MDTKLTKEVICPHCEELYIETFPISATNLRCQECDNFFIIEIKILDVEVKSNTIIDKEKKYTI